ncbi:hypothetical protein [Halovenus amylolytica]|uniref:hypothetical protein n=1 Tax=Halovenus amylolytica TaxID=2500550 RepID=UPI002FC561F8
METWRFLVSVAVMILVWSVVVTIVSEPPGPLSIVVVTVLSAGALFLSDRLVQRLDSE